MINDPYEYLLNFPSMEKYKKDLTDDEDYYPIDFFRDWIDTTIDGLQCDIVTDHTSELISDDEFIYLDGSSQSEVWIKVAENMTQQFLKCCPSCMAELAFYIIPKKLRPKIRKEIMSKLALEDLK